MTSRRARLATALAIGAAVLGLPSTAPAKGVGQLLSFGGVSVPTSPYRYIAITPNRFDRGGKVARAASTTVVAVHRDGGRLRRWWSTRGSYGIAATSYDISSGGGLSGDGSTLVLAGVPGNVFPPRFSHFAVLDTGFDPARGAPRGRTRPIRHLTLRGDFGVYAISPDGSTLYLTQRLPHNRGGPNYIQDHDLRALDLASQRLRPGTVGGAATTEHEPEGLPISRAASPKGDRAFTLYAGTALGSADFRPFIERLDTRTGVVERLRLPQLDAQESPFMLKLRTEHGGRELVIASTDSTSEPELRIDSKSLSVLPESDGDALPLRVFGAIVVVGLVAAAIVATRRRRVRPE